MIDPIIEPAPDPRKAYIAPAQQAVEMLLARVRELRDVTILNERTPASIATGMAGSKVPPEKLLQALAWGLHDNVQLRVLLNMAPYTRKDGAAWVRLVNAYATQPPPRNGYQQPAYVRPPKAPEQPMTTAQYAAYCEVNKIPTVDDLLAVEPAPEVVSRVQQAVRTHTLGTIFCGGEK